MVNVSIDPPITQQRPEDCHCDFCSGIIGRALLDKMAQRAALFNRAGCSKSICVCTQLCAKSADQLIVNPIVGGGGVTGNMKNHRCMSIV